jgi:putative glutamine amidotransferase
VTAAIPVIGIPAGVVTLPGRPPKLGVNRSYVRALAAAGAAPVLIPPLDEASLRRLYARLDGLLLPGGEDVAPALYGEQPLTQNLEVDNLRDQLELTLARWSISDDRPVLGICRGQQLLNVAMGGSLYQDLHFQKATHVDHAGHAGSDRSSASHRVELDPGSRIAQLLDEVSLDVNSFHHQAIKEAAPGLQISGRSPDGVVEAVESNRHRFLLAVQWHPEEMDGLASTRLFSGLVGAARDSG